jgi:hypothetical protein
MNINLAKDDISKKLAYIEIIGKGPSKEEAAHQILEIFNDAEKRLNNKKAVKLVYLENPTTSEGLSDIMERYCDGKIDMTMAKNEIKEMKEVYKKVLSEEYGIKI